MTPTDVLAPERDVVRLIVDRRSYALDVETPVLATLRVLFLPTAEIAGLTLGPNVVPRSRSRAAGVNRPNSDDGDVVTVGLGALTSLKVALDDMGSGAVLTSCSAKEGEGSFGSADSLSIDGRWTRLGGGRGPPVDGGGLRGGEARDRLASLARHSRSRRAVRDARDFGDPCWPDFRWRSLCSPRDVVGPSGGVFKRAELDASELALLDTLAGTVASRVGIDAVPAAAPSMKGPALTGAALARARITRGRATEEPTEAARDNRRGFDGPDSSSDAVGAESTLRSCAAFVGDLVGRLGGAWFCTAEGAARGTVGEVVDSTFVGDKGLAIGRSRVRNESLRTRPRPRRAVGVVGPPAMADTVDPDPA